MSIKVGNKEIGFNVAYQNKAFSTFTNEALIEFYYKLRLAATIAQSEPDHDVMADYYVLELQDELIRRLELRDKQLEALDSLAWGEDVESPTCPEYREHHDSIQKIRKRIAEMRNE